MTNIIDWILDLFRHEDAARAFVAAPEQTLRDAGLSGVNPAQLSAVAATAVPGMVLGDGDPVVGLQRAVSNHYGFAPSNEWAQSYAPSTSLLSPSYAPSPTFAPETNTDLMSHNQTQWASPEQSSGANSQAGAFNLGFGDFVFGGNKTTAGDGSTVVDGHVAGSIVSGDGAVLGDGNEVNNGDVWAGTGSNVTVGQGDIEDNGTTNTGSGSVIKDNEGPVFQDVDASGGNGGHASGSTGGLIDIGLGGDDTQGGNAGGGGIVIVNKDVSKEVSTETSHVSTTTTVSDYSDNSDHSDSSESYTDSSDNAVFDASHTSVFDNSHDTTLVDSAVDNSHDLSLASGNQLGF